MKHYNNQEVDEKIHTFLSKKMQKYPEIAEASLERIATQLAPHRTRQPFIWTTTK